MPPQRINDGLRGFAMTSKFAGRMVIAAILAGSLVNPAAALAENDTAWPGRPMPPFRPGAAGQPLVAPLRFLVQTDAGSLIEADADELPTPPMSRRLRDALSEDPTEPTEEDKRRSQRLRELLREIPPAGEDNTKRRDGSKDPSISGDARDLNKDESNELLSKPFIEERLPEPTAAGFSLPPIRAVSNDTSEIGNGRLPDDFDAAAQFAPVALPQSPAMRPGWVTPGLIRPWAAPNTYNHPLYFEDRMLERHGHDRYGYLQPFAGGVRFMSQVVMLPYLATVQPPCDIVYSKGYYRAGSPAPLLWQRPPYERRAAAVQAASTAGAFIALP